MMPPQAKDAEAFPVVMGLSSRLQTALKAALDRQARRAVVGFWDLFTYVTLK